MSREVLLDEQTFCSLAFIVGQGVLLRLLCPWDYSTLITGSSALYSQQQQRPSLEGPGYTPEVSPHCSSTRNSPLGADFLMKLGLPGTVLAFIFLSSGVCLFVCLFLLQVKNPLRKYSLTTLNLHLIQKPFQMPQSVSQAFVFPRASPLSDQAHHSFACSLGLIRGK